LALNKITQISAIGDVLYTVYHSYIYIVSVILLLGMVGAIILTAGNNHYTRVLYIENNKESGLSFININHILYYLKVKEKKTSKFKIKFINNLYKTKLTGSIYPFFDIINNKKKHSEDILGNLTYYIISNIIIGLLLLVVNSSFSLSVKYLEKGGGFECGFTSFVQTRERFNVIFYRVSLLFLVFDLEIILAFPYTALYQKNQNISKNNVLAFLYILVIGFIYELKEGALNIVKTAHSTDINMNNLITTQSEKIKLNNTNNTLNNNVQFDTLKLKSRI
jgi:NADH:ubiquinone oxidoreductase subunit 3 (subunit A)